MDEQIAAISQPEIAALYFLNPFSGKQEQFINERQATNRMLEEASKRIDELREDVISLRALVSKPLI